MQICLSPPPLLPPPACARMHVCVHDANYASLGKATHALPSGGGCVVRGYQQACRLADRLTRGDWKDVARLGRPVDEE